MNYHKTAGQTSDGVRRENCDAARTRGAVHTRNLRGVWRVDVLGEGMGWGPRENSRDPGRCRLTVRLFSVYIRG